MVYVVLKEGAKFSDVEFAIKSDSYFSHDDTRVQQVPDIDALKDMGHGVLWNARAFPAPRRTRCSRLKCASIIRP